MKFYNRHEMAKKLNLSNSMMHWLVSDGHLDAPTHLLTPKRYYYSEKDFSKLQKQMEKYNCIENKHANYWTQFEGFHTINNVCKLLDIPVISFRYQFLRGMPKPERRIGVNLFYSDDDIPMLREWLRQNYRKWRKR